MVMDALNLTDFLIFTSHYSPIFLAQASLQLDWMRRSASPINVRLAYNRKLKRSIMRRKMGAWAPDTST